MIIKNRKVKKTYENLTISSLTPLLIPNEGEIANNQNNCLLATLCYEYSDEEWLKDKHRILDARNEYRKLMKTINNR